MKCWTTFILQKFFPLASYHIPAACCIAAYFACVSTGLILSAYK